MDLRPVWGSPIKIKKGIDTNERLRGEAPPVEDTRVLSRYKSTFIVLGYSAPTDRAARLSLPDCVVN
jgi:hypothetical protein